jgi:hypothetical protein
LSNPFSFLFAAIVSKRLCHGLDSPPGITPDSPILLFDSGVGGLTVLDALRRMCPMRR